MRRVGGERHQQVRRETSARVFKSRPTQSFSSSSGLSAATGRIQALGIEQASSGRALPTEVLGEMLRVVRAGAVSARLAAACCHCPSCKLLQGPVSRQVRGVRSSWGDHPQPPFLHPRAINQCFHSPGAGTSSCVFELGVPAGLPAALVLDGRRLIPRAAHHLQLLPTGQPALELLEDGVGRRTPDEVAGWSLTTAGVATRR